MKRVWTKSWLAASVVAVAVLPIVGVRQGSASGAKRHNEIQLAHLRPGKDKLTTAVSLYGPNYSRLFPDSGDLLAWVDRENGRVLRVEVGSDGVLQTVTVSTIDALQEDKSAPPQASLSPKLLPSGRGLALGDSRKRVLELYGKPNSHGPSSLGKRELEFLFYAFDWAGSDVPQVMEVYCDHASGRVVQITLAAPSL